MQENNINSEKSEIQRVENNSYLPEKKIFADRQKIKNEVFLDQLTSFSKSVEMLLSFKKVDSFIYSSRPIPLSKIINKN